MTTDTFTDAYGDKLTVDATHWDKGRVYMLIDETGTTGNVAGSSLDTKQMRNLASLVTELANLMEENEE